MYSFCLCLLGATIKSFYFLFKEFLFPVSVALMMNVSNRAISYIYFHIYFYKSFYFLCLLLWWWMSRCPLLTTGRAVGINLHGVSNGGVSRPPEHHLSWARGQCQGWVNVMQAVTAVIQAVAAAVVWAGLQSIIHHDSVESRDRATRAWGQCQGWVNVRPRDRNRN